MSLRNWLVSAEKPFWYPHDDITVRKPISLHFYNNKRTKTLSMLMAIFWFVEVACFSTVLPNLEECKWDMNNFFSCCIFLTACLCLHESACFMTFNLSSCLYWYTTSNSCKYLKSKTNFQNAQVNKASSVNKEIFKICLVVGMVRKNWSWIVAGCVGSF